MRTIQEISEMDSIAAYNLAVKDCAQSATIKCTGDPETMSRNNCSPKDERFFGVDHESINKNLITKSS
jgi:hypothetical protein